LGTPVVLKKLVDGKRMFERGRFAGNLTEVRGGGNRTETERKEKKWFSTEMGRGGGEQCASGAELDLRIYS